jgi:hydrogenase maturation protease
MSGAADFWAKMERPGPAAIELGGVELRRGSRVRLRPRPRGDVFDLVLAGKTAIVESIEIDTEAKVHVAVTIEDDPGRHLGEDRQPGHRFFFGLDEVEPLDEQARERPRSVRVLVAGIGNMFLGDDGFGVEVARTLAERELPAGVEVVDFGIRGMDLAYALQEYDAAVLVDAAPTGEPPGTLSVIEPELEDDEIVLDTHGMHPVRVLRLAQELGATPARTLIVACEPEQIAGGEHDDDLLGRLSEPVRAAVAEAADLAVSVAAQLLQECESSERR